MPSNRCDRGSAIAELGPSLFLLVILIFFPALDLIGMGAQFGCAWYHNHLLLEELAVRKASESVAVQNEIKSKFGAQGIGKFCGIQSIADVVTYTAPPVSPVPTVSAQSTLIGKPFISLPVIGFTQLVWKVSGEATREDINP